MFSGELSESDFPFHRSTSWWSPDDPLHSLLTYFRPLLHYYVSSCFTRFILTYLPSAWLSGYEDCEEEYQVLFAIDLTSFIFYLLSFCSISHVTRYLFRSNWHGIHVDDVCSDVWILMLGKLGDFNGRSDIPEWTLAQRVFCLHELSDRTRWTEIHHSRESTMLHRMLHDTFCQKMLCLHQTDCR